METKLQHIYAISYAIQNVDEMTYWELLKVLEQIVHILGLDYLVYLEKNPVVSNYLTYRYDSRKWSILQSDSFPHSKHNDFATIFEEIDIKNWWMIQKIRVWKKVLGYMILWNKLQDRNVINVVANLLASMIETMQKNRYTREKKDYL